MGSFLLAALWALHSRLRLERQRVSVKFGAFTLTRYGSLEGEVIDVSYDANKDDKQGLVYLFRISLDATDIDGNKLAIAHGARAEGRRDGRSFNSHVPDRCGCWSNLFGTVRAYKFRNAFVHKEYT